MLLSKIILNLREKENQMAQSKSTRLDFNTLVSRRFYVYL